MYNPINVKYAAIIYYKGKEYFTWNDTISRNSVLSCSLRCAHYVNESQRRCAGSAPLPFINITLKNKFALQLLIKSLLN